MRWYVINPRQGELEFDCDDDIDGSDKVIEYLTDGPSRFKDQGEVEAKEMIIIRGERMQLIPPAGEYRLLHHKD